MATYNGQLCSEIGSGTKEWFIAADVDNNLVRLHSQSMEILNNGLLKGLI